MNLWGIMDMTGLKKISVGMFGVIKTYLDRQYVSKLLLISSKYYYTGQQMRQFVLQSNNTVF